MADDIAWVSDGAAKHLGITLRTLDRLIDDGQLPAYKFGRVIRLKQAEVDAFIESARVQPGTLKHLYADPRRAGDESPDDSGSPDEL